jgi:hypothetical protein
VHLDQVPLDVVPLEEVTLDVVLLGEVVHLNRVPPDMMPLEEGMSLEKVVPQGEVVHPDKVLPLGEEVPLEEPTLSMPAQGELVVDKLEEQQKRKLHQMEADSPAVIVIAYMCIIASSEMEKGCGSEWTRLGECSGLWKA